MQVSLGNNPFETQLLTLLSNSEKYIGSLEERNESVSKASVGWQLDHLYRVVITIYSVLRDSDPKDYKSSFNIKRFVVFNLGKIPRGKGKAPKQSVIDDESKISIESLKESLKLAKERVLLYKNLDPKSNFQHPVFGNLDVKNCKKLLIIHTKHHLKIIEEILNH